MKTASKIGSRGSAAKDKDPAEQQLADEYVRPWLDELEQLAKRELATGAEKTCCAVQCGAYPIGNYSRSVGAALSTDGDTNMPEVRLRVDVVLDSAALLFRLRELRLVKHRPGGEDDAAHSMAAAWCKQLEVRTDVGITMTQRTAAEAACYAQLVLEVAHLGMRLERRLAGHAQRLAFKRGEELRAWAEALP